MISYRSNFAQRGSTALIFIILIAVVIGAGVSFYLYRPAFLFTQEQPTQEQQPELLKVTTSLPLATPSEPLVHIIRKYGLDKKNGVEIEFLPMNIGDTEREFFAGNLKIRVGGPLSTADAIKTKNLSVRLLAPIVKQPFHVVVPVDSPIKTLADLKNKKLAVPAKVTASYQSTTTILRSAASLDPEKDLRLTFATPDQIVGLLQTGEVDAGIVSKPLSAGILTSGKFRSIVDLEQLWEEKEGLPLPFVAVVVHNDWYQANKEAVKRYIKTFYEAADMIKKNPDVLDEIKTEYLDKYKLSDPVVLGFMKKEYPAILFSEWEQAGVDGLKRYYEQGQKFGIIPTDLPPADEIIGLPNELSL